MNSNMGRILLALLLAGGIALAFAFRDRIDSATLETWVAGAGIADSLLLNVAATLLFLSQ